MSQSSPQTYSFSGPQLSPSKKHVMPRVIKILESLGIPEGAKSVFDIGCGNGSTLNALHQIGFEAVGVDPSEEGISIAKNSFP